MLRKHRHTTVWTIHSFILADVSACITFLFWIWWWFVLTCQLSGNGALPPFANNPPPGTPRDSTFGVIGRPNGRSPGNGAPPVNAAGPPPATKSSVTISNGRDPRRAKRWKREGVTGWGSRISAPVWLALDHSLDQHGWSTFTLLLLFFYSKLWSDVSLVLWSASTLLKKPNPKPPPPYVKLHALLEHSMHFLLLIYAETWRPVSFSFLIFILKW